MNYKEWKEHGPKDVPGRLATVEKKNIYITSYNVMSKD